MGDHRGVPPRAPGLTARAAALEPPQDAGYRRRVRSWVLYDVASSAFATTVLAAVFPVYYASVAGATLPSAATATQYYSATLSISVLVLAVIAPVLGTYADVAGAKVRLLGLSAGLGIAATAALYAVGPGDWLLASVLFGVARIGFGGANVVYDALLVHVAHPADIDRVSARGYAFGYLGGGILLAVNVGMVVALGDELGPRLALVSVAVWWAAFSIPLLRSGGEPAPATRRSAWSVTRSRLRSTLADLRRSIDLRRYLVAYLVGNDAIGTVISLAAIYASELGIGATETVLALLLVQFAGMGFALLFGHLPDRGRPGQPAVTAFVVGVLVVLPATGLAARVLLPADVSGLRPDAEGIAPQVVDAASLAQLGGRAWTTPQDLPGALRTTEAGITELSFTGRQLEVTYVEQPGGGTLTAFVDGRVARDADGRPAVRETEAEVRRVDATLVVDSGEPGPHRLRLEADGRPVTVVAVEVLEPQRSSSLPLIAALLAAVVALVALVATTVGRRLARPLARRLDTKASVILALSAYAGIATWGFVLDSVLEFWFLALAVAVVQGGSQALTRSLYAVLIPETMSGEYFGFFSVLSKFASVLSPLLFVASVAVFDSSRPAVLSLVVLFGLAIWLLTRVDVDRGRARARSRDAEVRASAS